jgi:hypothetical protein
MKTAVPKEGVWFDCETDAEGSLRTYWKGGVVVLRIAVKRARDHLGWAVLIAWVGPEKAHTHESGPFIQRETAEAVAIAAGIGVQVVMPARHVSTIPATGISGD